MVLPASVLACRAAVIARVAGAIIAIAAVANAQRAGAQTCAPAPGGPTCETATGVASLGDPDGSDLTVGNPIHPLTGNKYQDDTDAAPLPGAFGLEIRRHYHSNYAADDAVWGRGWRLSYDTRLFRTGDRIQIVQADGRRLLFGTPAGERASGDSAVTCPSSRGGQGELVQDTAGYRWTWPDRRELRFDRDGRLVRIGPAAGNDRESVVIARDPDGRIGAVIDPAGRRMTIDYDGAGRLRQIVHPFGTWRYRVGSEGQLQSVIGPDDVVRRYAYDDHGHRARMTAITVAVGGGSPRLVDRWSYDADGGAIRHVRADGTTLEVSRDEKPAGRESPPFATGSDDGRGTRRLRSPDTGGRRRSSGQDARSAARRICGCATTFKGGSAPAG
jgi:YD repeat-containing protein